MEKAAVALLPLASGVNVTTYLVVDASNPESSVPDLNGHVGAGQAGRWSAALETGSGLVMAGVGLYFLWLA